MEQGTSTTTADPGVRRRVQVLSLATILLLGLPGLATAHASSTPAIESASPDVERPSDWHQAEAPAATSTVSLFDPVGVEILFPGLITSTVDFTGDGKADFARSAGDEFVVIPGGVAGFGTQMAAPLYDNGSNVLEFGDVTGDGQPDAVSGYRALSVFPGGGGEAILPRVDYPAGEIEDLAIGDFTGDGRLDVLAADQDQALVQFYIQQSDGSLLLQPLTNAPAFDGYNEFAAGDFDGNGLSDLASYHPLDRQNPVIYLQTSPGVFDSGTVVDATNGGTEQFDYLLVADIDGDGIDDLMMHVAGEATLIWQGAGAVDTKAADLPVKCPTMRAFEANGDGMTDLVCKEGDGFALLLQSSPRQFTIQRYLMDREDLWTIVIADYVGDSRPDLIASQSLDHRLYQGFDPSYMASHPGEISGSATSEGTVATGLCVDAISTVDGRLINTVEVGSGDYRLDVPPGLYILHHEECRDQADRPDGESYAAAYLGDVRGFDYYPVGIDGSVVVDFDVSLRKDSFGGVVDNRTGEPLEGIDVHTVVKDQNTGILWYRTGTQSGPDGSFTITGGMGYDDPLYFFDDKGVYPPQMASAPGTIDLGWWGLVDPVLADIHGSVFVADILWLREEGITKGCNPPTNDFFCPDTYVTRAQMAAFLVRYLDLDSSGSVDFVDDDGSIFEQDIERLADAGITKGCNPPLNDRFCPDDFVTREQMAAFLVRAFSLPPAGPNLFIDDDGSPFEDTIARLAAAGITRGCNPPANDRFCPKDPVTREQMAAFLHRADGLR